MAIGVTGGGHGELDPDWWENRDQDHSLKVFEDENNRLKAENSRLKAENSHMEIFYFDEATREFIKGDMMSALLRDRGMEYREDLFPYVMGSVDKE